MTEIPTLTEDLTRLARLVAVTLTASGYEDVEVHYEDGVSVRFYDNDFGHEVALRVEAV